MGKLSIDASSTVNRYVTFMLEGEKYGIDVMSVQEVLRLTEIAPVPGAPSYVLGIINLRGNVVSVIDTRSRFGLTSKEADDLSRIIVTEAESQIIGMLVDSVAEVIDVDQSDIESAPNVGNDDSSLYIDGVVSRDSDLLILLDLNKLLSSSEWADIASM